MIGISTTYFALQGKNIYDSVAEADKIGFGLIELGAAHKHENSIEATLKRIRKDFPEKKFTLHGLFPPLKKKLWFNPSEGLTARNKKIIAGFFSAAQIVEAELVSFHPGFANKVSCGPSPKKGLTAPVMKAAIPKEKAFANAFKVFSLAQNLSEKTGIGFAIENLVKRESENPLFVSKEEFENFFSKFPDQGLLLDYGHALSCGNLEELLELDGKVKEAHLHYSLPLSKENSGDNHLPITSLQQLEPLSRIRQLGKIPLVFEHGTNVSRQELLLEKGLLESFVKNNVFDRQKNSCGILLDLKGN